MPPTAGSGRGWSYLLSWPTCARVSCLVVERTGSLTVGMSMSVPCLCHLVPGSPPLLSNFPPLRPHAALGPHLPHAGMARKLQRLPHVVALWAAEASLALSRPGSPAHSLVSRALRSKVGGLEDNRTFSPL